MKKTITLEPEELLTFKEMGRIIETLERYNVYPISQSIEDGDFEEIMKKFVVELLAPPDLAAGILKDPAAIDYVVNSHKKLHQESMDIALSELAKWRGIIRKLTLLKSQLD